MDSTTTERPHLGGKGVWKKPLIEKLKLLVVFICLAVLIWVSHPTPPYFYSGLALIILGTLIRIWAGGHLTRDQRLTTSGPYAYSRNPFYLGRLLWIVGFAVMTGVTNSGVANLAIYGILVFALIIFFVYYMPRKEAREGGRLKEYFGEDYDTWKANVPSLFPRLTPYKMNPKKWNSKLYFGNDGSITGNKEIWTTLAVILIAALFFLRMKTLG